MSCLISEFILFNLIDERYIYSSVLIITTLWPFHYFLKACVTHFFLFNYRLNFIKYQLAAKCSQKNYQITCMFM